LSEHRVILGDCLDPVTGLASLPDQSVDHVICDPPYEAEAHTLGRRRGKAGGGAEEAPLDFGPISNEVRLAAAGEMARLARRWVVLFCQVEAVGGWATALATAGLNYRRSGVWVKPGAAPQFTGDRPGMGYEAIVCAHAIGRSTWNGGGRHGIWVEPPCGEGLHMTQKPLGLMEALVRDFTDPGELICDPFAGSGTTGVACKRLGRRFVGWERDPKYHAIAVKRIEAAREQYRLPLPSEPEPKQIALLPTAGPHRGAAAGAGGSLPGPAAVPAMERGA
jgi:site-specific DNA-methyltransferase (adenine-specific)